MSFPVVNGSQTMCTFGLAPSVIVITPEKAVLSSEMAAATIFDNVPFKNIQPFGLCQSLANPITAAQTAAALGVLTPGTCIPVLPAPWVPGAPTVMIGNMPALTSNSQLMCAYGGVIKVMASPAVTTSLP